MKRKLSLIFIASILLSVVFMSLKGESMTIGGGGIFSLSSFIGFIILAAGTAWCIIKYKSKIKPNHILLTIWLGVSIIDLILIISHFSSTLIFIPNLIIWWIGILIGFIFTKLTSTMAKICLIVISLVAMSWCTGPGYRLYLSKLTIESSNGQVKELIPAPIVLNNLENESVDLSSLQGKYIVLDFWSSSCDICYQNFPEVQKLYDEFNNDNISIYAVHCFNMENDESAVAGSNIMAEEGYSFPCLSVPINGYALGVLKIKTYPTVLIIDKDSNTIVYRGNMGDEVATILKTLL